MSPGREEPVKHLPLIHESALATRCAIEVSARIGQVADLDAVSFERPARKRRRSLVPIAALIVVMALAGVRVHHWWTHPALFGTSDRSRMSVVTNPLNDLVLPVEYASSRPRRHRQLPRDS